MTTYTAAQAELVDARGLSEILSRSLASLARDDAAGRLPRAVRIGRSKKWRVAEIRDWIKAGCPARDVWEKMARLRR
jgi:predicted DNA-binding transcriptional regulator AlpA